MRFAGITDRVAMKASRNYESGLGMQSVSADETSVSATMWKEHRRMPKPLKLADPFQAQLRTAADESSACSQSRRERADQLDADCGTCSLLRSLRVCRQLQKCPCAATPMYSMRTGPGPRGRRPCNDSDRTLPRSRYGRFSLSARSDLVRLTVDFDKRAQLVSGE